MTEGTRAGEYRTCTRCDWNSRWDTGDWDSWATAGLDTDPLCDQCWDELSPEDDSDFVYDSTVDAVLEGR